jgi:L-ascorbate metabolism protein UlaG (beta-lactamase superfamily)
MSTQTLYWLASSTVVEPLVNKWAAWGHLIPPVPASLHLQRYQINLMESYSRYPKIHIQACLNPQLRYGPFIDIPADRAGEVKELLANTKAAMSENLELANSVIQFSNHLAQSAKGEALDSYYERIPEALGGFVELVYDYMHRPMVRHIESLLYESRYYRKDLQSLRLFRLLSDGSRPFFMSTPRLLQEGQVDWSVPFENPEVDELFNLDRTPRPLGYIREMLGLNSKDDGTLQALVSDQATRPPEEWAGSGIRIRYIGHACVLVEYNGISILTDPWIGIPPADGGMERFSYCDLPERIDYALITHAHPDHFCLETLLRLRNRIDCLVTPRSSGMLYGDISLKLLARKIGFKKVYDLDTFESLSFPNGEIIAIPFLGEQADLAHGKAAYVVRAGTQLMMFGADSNCLDKRIYSNVRRVLGPIQTVFIGMECVGAPLSWMYGPLMASKLDNNLDQSRRLVGCNAARAMEICQALETNRVYVYAMGLEPWLEYLLGLAVSDDSVQIKESEALLVAAREKRFLDARILRGSSEMYIEELSSAHLLSRTAM